MDQPIRVCVNVLPPDYEVHPSDDLDAFHVGKMVTFEYRVGSIGTRRVGELIAVWGTRVGFVGFEVRPLDERGEFILWVPVKNIGRPRRSLMKAHTVIFGWFSRLGRI